MPFDSEGNFSRLHNWEDDRINGIDIVTDHMDAEDNNFAEGLSECLLKNGNSKMMADLNINNFNLKNVAHGLSDLDAVNKSQLDNLQTTVIAYVDAIIPKGTIFPFCGTTAPSGFLICNGAEVSRTTYADLFAVIGTAYGEGNGVTTFNIPDYRDKTLFMRNDSAVGEVSAGSIPDHRHSVAVTTGSTGWSGGGALNGTSYSSYASEDTSLFDSSLYSQTINAVIPTHVSCNFIIKY